MPDTVLWSCGWFAIWFAKQHVVHAGLVLEDVVDPGKVLERPLDVSPKSDPRTLGLPLRRDLFEKSDHGDDRSVLASNGRASQGRTSGYRSRRLTGPSPSRVLSPCRWRGS